MLTTLKLNGNETGTNSPARKAASRDTVIIRRKNAPAAKEEFLSRALTIYGRARRRGVYATNII